MSSAWIVGTRSAARRPWLSAGRPAWTPDGIAAVLQPPFPRAPARRGRAPGAPLSSRSIPSRNRSGRLEGPYFASQIRQLQSLARSSFGLPGQLRARGRRARILVGSGKGGGWGNSVIWILYRGTILGDLSFKPPPRGCARRNVASAIGLSALATPLKIDFGMPKLVLWLTWDLFLRTCRTTRRRSTPSSPAAPARPSRPTIWPSASASRPGRCRRWCASSTTSAWSNTSPIAGSG